MLRERRVRNTLLRKDVKIHKWSYNIPQIYCDPPRERSEIPSYLFYLSLVPSQKYRKFSVTSRRVIRGNALHLSWPRRRARELHSWLISKTLKKTRGRERAVGVPRSTTGWMETYRHAVKIPGRPCIFTFPLPTSATRPYVPFIPRNDDVRVCMRRTGAAASASGNSDRDTLRGSFIHRFNGVGECENPKKRHVDTKMAPLRVIIPEIDALWHAFCTKKFVIYSFFFFFF